MATVANSVGSMLALEALLFGVRWAMMRTFDRWFAASNVLLAVTYIGSTYLFPLTKGWN
jgi:hypothetical protein